MLRIERILTQRLQNKYLVELADIAGLTGQYPRDKLTFVDALRVQSCDGIDANEFLFYHGAPSGIIEQLQLSGLDPRRGGENAGKLFGVGTYLATNSSKSDIYTKPSAAGERCVLVVRAALGEPHRTAVPMPKANKPPDRSDGRGPLNSVVALTHAQGGCVEHPEYIVYKETQTLPQCVAGALRSIRAFTPNLPPNTHTHTHTHPSAVASMRCLCAHEPIGDGRVPRRFAIWYKHKLSCRCTHCW